MVEHGCGGSEKAGSGAHWHLYLTAFSVNICIVNGGCIMAWTSSAERFLVIEGAYPGPIDRATWSWIAGIFLFSGMLSPLPQCFLTDMFGRKPCLLGIGVTSVISWLLITAANGPTMILMGRFLAGLAIASLLAIVAVYNSEIAPDDKRSTLGAFAQLSATLGYLISYSVGPYVKPYVLGIVSGSIALFFLAVFIFMPESPHFLLMKGDKEGAMKALAWLRGQPQSSARIEKELASILTTLQDAKAGEAPLSERLKSLLGERGNLKSLSICGGLFAFVQFSGIIPVLFFAESIFRATGSPLDPAVSTIVVGAMQMMASLGTIALTRFFSIKALLIFSAVGMTVAHGMLGYYFQVKLEGGNVSSLGLLPVTALVLFIVSYCFGFGPLPWAAMGEMFGSDTRAAASALLTTLRFVVGFFLTWKFASLLDVLGAAWTFWLFGICCAFSSLYITILIPNTRGKTIREIQDKLRGITRYNLPR